MKVCYLFCNHRSIIVHIILLGIIDLLVNTSPAFCQVSDKTDTMEVRQAIAKNDTIASLAFDSETEFNKQSFGGVAAGGENVPSFWASYLQNPMRLGVKYEVAYKFTKPDEIKKDRFSLRLEYSKLLFNKITIQVDTKISTYLNDDHRTRTTTFWIDDNPKKAEMAFGGKTRDAYLQTSFNKTSIKAGIQTLVWGESDFAAVTDEISPLDYREPLNLNLDELRLGQLALTIDQYSPFGDWSGFFIPDPKLNEYPKKGTGYYYDPFNGSVEYQLDQQKGIFFEYGIRWKKTFGKSDVSLMSASLINNDYASHMVAPGLIIQSKMRYSMAGLTFNYAINNFLVKGEVALKSPKPYNDESFQIVKKNALDASLGVDYSPSSTLTLSMEAVNYHIVGWNDKIQGTPKDNYMMLLILSKTLINNNLSLNWVTMYNGPYTNFFNLLTTSYNWNDHITLYFDALIPVTNNINSGLYIYRDQKQVAFKIQYQF